MSRTDTAGGPGQPADPKLPIAEPDGRQYDLGWRRAFLLQLVIATLSTTALHATRPMVTYRALGLGAGPLEIGVVQSAFSLLPVLTAVALGRLVDRFGEGRFLAVAMATMSLGGFVASQAGSLFLLGVAQTILGFGQVTNLIAGQAMIANRGPRDGRENRYGAYSTAASLGQLAGPAIAAILVGGAIGASVTPPGTLPGPFAGNPEAPAFLFASALSACACLLAMRLRLRPENAYERRVDGVPPGLVGAAWNVLRRPDMASAMLVSITVISSIDVVIAYLPAYGEAIGLSVGTVGVMLSVRAGSSLVSRLFMGRMIQLIGPRKLLAASMALASIGIVLLPFTGSVGVLLVLMVLIGLGLGVGQPMTTAWVVNRSPRHERGLALGVRLTGNRASLLLVPTLMGAIAGASGIGAIWLTVAAFLSAGAVVALHTRFDDHAMVASGPDPDLPR